MRATSQFLAGSRSHPFTPPKPGVQNDSRTHFREHPANGREVTNIHILARYSHHHARCSATQGRPYFPCHAAD